MCCDVLADTHLSTKGTTRTLSGPWPSQFPITKTAPPDPTLQRFSSARHRSLDPTESPDHSRSSLEDLRELMSPPEKRLGLLAAERSKQGLLPDRYKASS